MKYPKVIFFDAVGTLFGVKGTVGEIYSAIASQFGVNCSPDSLNTAFLQSFKTAPPLAFRAIDIIQVPELEYQWWRTVAEITFAQVGVLDQFANFDDFFRQLYDYFATSAPWFLYTDVFPALKYWQHQRVELGIISNFDSRIYEVLDLLGLTSFFSSITISSTTGVAKPNDQIFKVALEKHDCHPLQAWHIGDSQKEDYEGAKAVGIKPFLVDRSQVRSHQKETINSFKNLIW